MADFKLKYAASANFTITLASLATSATLVAGREGTAIVNTANLYVDALFGGFITTGTSPTTGNIIEVWMYGAFHDTPTYPDVLDGTDSVETFTSVDIKRASMALAAVLVIDGTSDRKYYFKPISIASLFGGIMPTHLGPFVTHNTAVPLNATGGNHQLTYTPAHYQSV